MVTRKPNTSCCICKLPLYRPPSLIRKGYLAFCPKHNHIGDSKTATKRSKQMYEDLVKECEPTSGRRPSLEN